MAGPEPITLVIDDSEDDAFLIGQAFEKQGLGTQLIHLASGEEAVEYFSERGPEHPIPHLVLTDLKMPGMGGFGLLEWLRTQSFYGKLPVVVLSSSHDEGDILRAKQLGVHEFITKPSSFEGYLSLAPTIHDRWLSGNLAGQNKEGLNKA